MEDGVCGVSDDYACDVSDDEDDAARPLGAKAAKICDARLSKLFASIAPKGSGVVGGDDAADDSMGVLGHSARLDSAFGSLTHTIITHADDLPPSKEDARYGYDHYDASASVSVELQRSNALAFLETLREKRRHEDDDLAPSSSSAPPEFVARKRARVTTAASTAASTAVALAHLGAADDDDASPQPAESAPRARKRHFRRAATSADPLASPLGTTPQPTSSSPMPVDPEGPAAGAPL